MTACEKCRLESPQRSSLDPRRRLELFGHRREEPERGGPVLPSLALSSAFRRRLAPGFQSFSEPQKSTSRRRDRVRLGILGRWRGGSSGLNIARAGVPLQNSSASVWPWMRTHLRPSLPVISPSDRSAKLPVNTRELRIYLPCPPFGGFELTGGT